MKHVTKPTALLIALLILAGCGPKEPVLNTPPAVLDTPPAQVDLPTKPTGNIADITLYGYNVYDGVDWQVLADMGYHEEEPDGSGFSDLMVGHNYKKLKVPAAFQVYGLHKELDWDTLKADKIHGVSIDALGFPEFDALKVCGCTFWDTYEDFAAVLGPADIIAKHNIHSERDAYVWFPNDDYWLEITTTEDGVNKIGLYVTEYFPNVRYAQSAEEDATVSMAPSTIALDPDSLVVPHNAFYDITLCGYNIFEGVDWQVLADKGYDQKPAIGMSWLNVEDNIGAYGPSTYNVSGLHDVMTWEDLESDKIRWFSIGYAASPTFDDVKVCGLTFGDSIDNLIAIAGNAEFVDVNPYNDELVSYTWYISDDYWLCIDTSKGAIKSVSLYITRILQDYTPHNH